MTSDSSAPTLSVVILAAGAGKRMVSTLPKPLHAVAGVPMIEHVLATARSFDPVDITIVASPRIQAHLAGAEWASALPIVIQDPPEGTGDAVRLGLAAGAAGDIVLVLYADSPLVTADALRALIACLAKPGKHVAVMTCTVDNAAEYGRIDRDDDGRMRVIVEHAVDDKARRIGRTEINSGYMALDRSWAVAALATLPKHAGKNEYFLTDLVEVAYAEDPNSVDTASGNPDLLMGVNDRIELAAAEDLLYARKRHELLEGGVTLISPASNLIALDAVIGKDTVIGPGCVIESGSRIGSDCRIGPYAIIRSSSIGDRVRIESSTVEDSTIGDDSDVGPYSHLRGGAAVGAHVHIGNFVEIKNATLEDDVRAGHFSYIGDASLGSAVNIGAGTVTCNFDGVDKHRTDIGAGAFIGSDTMLIAPLSVGAGARTGAGAVVTKDVADGATVVGMPARQVRRRAIDPTNPKAEGAG